MNNTEPQVSPVDKVIDSIAAAMEEWSKEQQTSIGASVRQRLDKHRDQLLLTLMGFEKDHWAANVWKIDHCNGRSGNSPISDFLKTSQEAALKEWLSTVTLPKMTDKFRKNIEEEMQASYEREITSQLWTLVKNRVSDDLNKLLDTVLKPTLLEKIGKTHALLKPT